MNKNARIIITTATTTSRMPTGMQIWRGSDPNIPFVAVL